MRTLFDVLQAASQTAQQAATQGAPGAPGPGGPPGGEHGFSYREALFQLVQFVGWFLSVGAVGFRFGVVRRVRGISDEAKGILRADNAGLLGVLGVVLLFVSYLGGPYVSSIAEHKSFAQALPKNIAPFQFKMVNEGVEVHQLTGASFTPKVAPSALESTPRLGGTADKDPPAPHARGNNRSNRPAPESRR